MSHPDIPGSLWLRAHGDPAVVAFNAVVEALGDGSPHEWNPLGDGVAVMVRGIAGLGGQSQLFVLTADVGTAAAVVMTGLLPGDTVRVVGIPDAEQDPLDQVVAIRPIRRVHDLQVIRRAIQPWQVQPDAPLGA